MPRRLPPWVTILALTLLAACAVVLAGLLVREFSWRRDYALAQPASPSPDAAYVAEVRRLPESPLLAPGSTGVFVEGRRHWLRSVKAQLVFAGACDHVDTRWMTPRRLVIECELRAGEPRLLQALVDDVVVELVVQGRFAYFRLRPS